MENCPNVGDKVVMSSMGDDVRIKIVDIPEDQPLVETDGFYIVIDQYGEEHLVELDCDTWVTASEDALSAEGFERYFERGQVVADAAAAPKP